MNGRVYDYALGRFLSVDPFIQFPLNSQSLNPYSYILNNPLAGVDPTGYECTAMTGSNICGVDTGAANGQTSTTLRSTVQDGDGSTKTVTLTKTTGSDGAHSYTQLSGTVTNNGGRTGSGTNTTSQKDETEGKTPGQIGLGQAHDVANKVMGVGAAAIDPCPNSSSAGGCAAETAINAAIGGLIGKALHLRPTTIYEDARALGISEKDIAAAKAEANQAAHDAATSLQRPYVRKPVRAQVALDAPRDAAGRIIDPNTLKPSRDGNYDLGHKYGREFRREQQKAQAEGLSQREFNDRMNDPDIYQYEDRSSNRSRVNEQKDDH